MTRKSIFNMIFSIVFIGVILSFSLFFAMTLMLSPEYNIEDEYFDSAKTERTMFSVYDDACFKNRLFHKFIVTTEYTVFGNVVSKDVIKGDGGFLFMSGKNKFDYDYISDYMGKATPDSSNLEKIYQYVEMRRLAYENLGKYYLLAVIPNSQTLYSEYMPSAYGEVSPNTALSVVDGYLKEKGYENFLDLTPYLQNAKYEGLLYNNTENSINALGAYYIYSALIERLNADGVASNKAIERSFFDLYTHYTDGKTVAELAGISSMVQNETISMSNATEYMYTTVELFEDLETTFTKSQYSDTIPIKPSVLLELTGEWDKIQLMPYFSNTFGMASYRVSYKYSRAALENSNPYIVIQLIHEDELMSIIKPEISTSYNSGLRPGQNPYKTARPQSVNYTMPDEYTVCVTGEVEKGSKVAIFGDYFDTVNVTEMGERFVAVVKLNESAVGKDIFILAKTEGKTVSDHVIIRPEMSDISGSASGGVVVGANSHIYKEKYGEVMIPDRDTLDTFSEALNEDLERYRNATVNELSIIYGIVPEKLSVYRAGSPEVLTEQISDFETLRSLMRVEFISCGAEALDFSRTLRENLTLGKLYNQADGALTDLGYYCIYKEILDVISARYPSIAPHGIDYYTWQTYRLSVGSYARALGFDVGELSEKASHAIIKNTATTIQGNSASIDKTKAYITHNYVGGLPSAIIIRDGVGTRAVDFLADHFGTMYVLDEGVYDIPDEVLEKVSPDYIIYLCGESNIGRFITEE